MIDSDRKIDRRSSHSNESDYLVLLRNWATFEHYKDNFLDPMYKDERDYQDYAIK